MNLGPLGYGLHYAAAHNAVAVSKELLHFWGSDPTRRNEACQTALQLAVSRGATEAAATIRSVSIHLGFDYSADAERSGDEWVPLRTTSPNIAASGKTAGIYVQYKDAIAAADAAGK